MQGVKSETDFLRLALNTWENVLEGLENQEVVLENERELKYYFFHRCLILMKKESLTNLIPSLLKTIWMQGKNILKNAI